MKRKNLLKQWQFWVAMIVVVGILSLIIINNETHFKIYDKDGVEVERINNFGIPHQSYFYDLSKEDISVEWLDETCECLEINCSYIFKSSETFESQDKFVGATYEGMIWYIKDKKGNEIASLYCPQGENCFEEECTPCPKYKCGDYTIETWNQIK